MTTFSQEESILNVLFPVVQIESGGRIQRTVQAPGQRHHRQRRDSRMADGQAEPDPGGLHRAPTDANAKTQR